MSSQLSYGSYIPSNAMDVSVPHNNVVALTDIIELQNLGLIGPPQSIQCVGTNTNNSGLVLGYGNGWRYLSPLAPNNPYGNIINAAVSQTQNYSMGAFISNTVANATSGTINIWGPTTGLGRTGSATLIAPISNAVNYTQVALGNECGAAVDVNGALWTWGQNSGGRTGLGTTSGTTLFPTKITFSNSAVTTLKVCLSDATGVAWGSDGNLWGWGNGSYFGANSTSTYSTPIIITSAQGKGTITDMYAGQNNAYMIANGALYTTGSNSNYLTGLGTNSGNTLTFTQAGTDGDWKILAKTGNTGVFGGFKANNALFAFGSTSGTSNIFYTGTAYGTTPTMVSNANTITSPLYLWGGEYINYTNQATYWNSNGSLVYSGYNTGPDFAGLQSGGIFNFIANSSISSKSVVTISAGPSGILIIRTAL